MAEENVNIPDFESLRKRQEEFTRQSQARYVAGSFLCGLGFETHPNKGRAFTFGIVCELLVSFTQLQEARIEDAMRIARRAMDASASSLIFPPLPKIPDEVFDYLKLMQETAERLSGVPPVRIEVHDGKEYEVVDSFPAHLREDASFLTCDYCGRKTWTLVDKNSACGMTQPGGMACPGVFR